MNLWTKVGSPKIFIGPKVVDTGQGIASCPYAAALTCENATLGRNGHEVVTGNLRFHPG